MAALSIRRRVKTLSGVAADRLGHDGLDSGPAVHQCLGV